MLYENLRALLNGKNLLRRRIEEVKERLASVNQELDDIKADDAYNLLSKVDDLELYFGELKSKLTKELEVLIANVNAKNTSHTTGQPQHGNQEMNQNAQHDDYNPFK
jgi:predicted nuclease with TOPRIM domain